MKITRVEHCDTIIATLTEKYTRALKLQVQLEKRLRRFDTFADKYGRELNELEVQLRLIAENLLHLPEGILREEHLSRQKALELRQRTLLLRMPEYSPALRTLLTKEYDDRQQWANILTEHIAQVRRRKEELLGG